jgi:two-component system NtrC family response regulator
LRQVLERTLLLAGKARLDAADFREDEKLRGDERLPGASPAGFGGHGLTLEQAERQMIEQVLAQHEGNISRVAKALGLSRAALYRRLEKHGLAAGNEDAP